MPKGKENMSEENLVVVKQERTKGNRGDVGIATAGLTIKQMWRGSKTRLRLRAFARDLVKQKNQVAIDWFAHKSGSLNQNRSDKNVARVLIERQATKAAHRKSKGASKPVADVPIGGKK